MRIVKTMAPINLSQRLQAIEAQIRKLRRGSGPASTAGSSGGGGGFVDGSSGGVIDLGDIYYGSTLKYLYSVSVTTQPGDEDITWAVSRWDRETEETITGTGTPPSSTAEIEALTWPA